VRLRSRTRRASPHPALRVPVRGDGAGRGDWDQVPWTADGVPLLVADPDAYLAAVGASATAPLDDLPAADRRQLATYLPEVEAPGPLRDAIGEVLDRHLAGGARVAIEAGCSVGCDTRTLARVADHVIAFDTDVAAVRVAHALIEGRAIANPIRHEGDMYSSGSVIQASSLQNVTVVAGDALDPPLQAAAAELVVAVNLLDSVAQPLNLLGQLDAMLALGGLLIVASPFAWNDHLTPSDEQLWVIGGGRPGSEVLRDLLEGGTPLLPHLSHEVVEQFDVPWVLRDHDRATHHFLVHVCVSRKR